MSRLTTVRVRAGQLLRGASPTHNERTALEELSSYGYVMRQYDNAQAVWSLNPEQARTILAKHAAPQPALSHQTP